MLQQLFNILAYAAGLLGQFDPQHYNLQHFIYMVAAWMGYSITIAVG